jgi:hypothetical protein
MNKLEKLHQYATALMAHMKKTKDEGDAAETMKGYNERRKKLVAGFKPVLAEMDAAFNRGEHVGGCGGMKEYCKTYKPKGMVTYARVRQILTGVSGNEGKVKSLDLLKELITVVSTESPITVIEKASAICDQIKWLPKAWKEEEEQDSLHSAAEQLKATLESVEPTTAPGDQEQQCDYTEVQVAAMFAQGGN